VYFVAIFNSGAHFKSELCWYY